MAAPKIEALDHLVLTVAEIEVTCEFYKRALGFDVNSFGEGRKALTFGYQKINLHQGGRGVEPKAALPTPGSGDLCFLTNQPIEEIQRHLEFVHVPVIEGPVERTGATGPIISIYFRDPDGNLIEVANQL
ncbi:MAG: VOC family protein [Alphaproteobacteria bacterium]|nr:VOC family protein [Alphaproteobacteria bacterium]